MGVSLRAFLIAFCVFTELSWTQNDSRDFCSPEPSSVLRWVDAASLSIINGGHFTNLTSPYSRLPVDAKEQVRSMVWYRSLQTAGMAIAFESDAQHIYLDYALLTEELSTPLMPTTGVAGFELWAEDPKSKEWQWIANLAPDSWRQCQRLAVFQHREEGHISRHLIYLPLYNGVQRLKIGIDNERTLVHCEGDCGTLGLQRRPVVWYGSSITQGCASAKPGDAYTNAIGRALGRPVANFGFDGSCLYDSEVMSFLLQIDAAVYILDCNPNAELNGYGFIYEQSKKLLRQIRAARPHTPVILASSTPQGPVWLDGGAPSRHTDGIFATQRVFAEEHQHDAALYYVHGDAIFEQTDQSLGYWEYTVDGTHPTSLGMQRFAEHWTPILQDILKDRERQPAIDSVVV